MLETELLPHIPHDKRIAPNDLIRSALFTVSNHNAPRAFLKNQKIGSFRSTEIIYTGEELRQDDEDVWLQIIYAASTEKSNHITFKPYTFLSHLGWAQRTQYCDRLKASLLRLSATALSLYNPFFEKGIAFSLVRKFEWHTDGEQLRHWSVWIEPEVMRLFGELGKMYSKIHWEQRKKLKPLAKWLHAFYSSHAIPEPIHLDRLMQLCGSKMKTVKHFKSNLRNSMIELVKISFIEPDVYIDENAFLHVTRTSDAMSAIWTK